MNNVEITLTKKQSIAWKYLTDDVTTELLFGGGAGSSKSFLGCLWITTMCIQYPKTRYLIGRTKLTALRLTTINTLLDLFKMMNLKQDINYNYNLQSNIIKFSNDSEIIFKDLEYYPSDPEFDSLGSLELTGAFVDEAQQTTEMCLNVLKTRLRYKLTEYNLQPKILLTCNPAQNHLKRTFYIPYIENRLPEYKKYVPSNAFDNPYLPKSYIETLSKLPEQQKQRLLLGNWDYTDDINNLFNYDDIISSYYKHEQLPTGKIYASLDVARFGEDKSVLIISKDTTILEINMWTKLDTNQLAEKVREKMLWYKIPPQQIIGDSDGVGGGIVDTLRIKGFVNNSSPLYGENYQNLKTQCYFYLSEKFKNGLMSINIDKPELLDIISQELLATKIKNIDKDTKKSITPKEEIKEKLGRSPDISDALAMLMYFFIENKKKGTGKYSLSILN